MRRAPILLLAMTVFGGAAVAVVDGQRQGGPAGSVREVTVRAIPGVIAAGSAWTAAWQGTDNADGLVGTEDGVLFAQEQPQRVSHLDRNDRVSVYAEQTRGAGSLAVDAQGRVLAAQRTCTDPGLGGGPCTTPTAIGIVYPERERKILADHVDAKPLGRINDLVVSRRGDVYFTSGAAFHMDPSGHVTTIATNLRTNGVMLSPDEKTLYITNGGEIVAFDVQLDGRAANQRSFAKLEAGGNGDGLAVDGAGRLYVTSMAAGVQVFDAAGAYLGAIDTPRSVISAAFGGPGKRTLYVVGAGALGADGREFATPAGVRNNAKTIYRIPMLAQGLAGRGK